MKNLWDFYENMDEVVYVSDMDTYEMIYMNRYGREKLGISSMEDLKGKPCYKILQNGSSPCTMCTNDRLKQGEFYEWTYSNHLLGRTYTLKDTMLEQGEKRYRFEMAIDTGIQEQRELAVREYTTNEALVNEALRLALSEPTPEKSIEVLLRYVGSSLKSERIYIFEETPEHTFCNTYEWCAEGIIPQKENLQNVPAEVVELWFESFRKNENIVIKNLQHIRESDPKVYDYLEPQNIDSLVVSPLVFNDQIIGFYGVDNPPREFLDHISVMFMVLGHFIVSILRRRDLVRRLETLSYYDQLTGALNRHGMNEFVANVDEQASIGIVYCDVMGLKNINDTEGHLEGDALLVRAYECLSRNFPKNSVFRIGGDEFLVMSSKVNREDMEMQIRRLQEDMPNYHVDMALGWVWEPHCNNRITELLKEADRRMYEKKAKYYEVHANGRVGRGQK